MQNKTVTGILIVLVVASLAWSAFLDHKVGQLEQLMAPVKAQRAAQARQTALREKFDQKVAQDRLKYSREQLADAERLYQVANQKWGTLEASNSLQEMIQKYSDIDRTGCAVLYVAQMSQGDQRTHYLQDCIDKYNNCFYGDGVQVGVYARFLLAQDYRKNGETAKARLLFDEIKAHYPDAVDHGGSLLVDSIKPD
ncbi:MAG TPA: hypothetical protein VFY06_08985 [Verrucomicrobiae bacterium]|nr:hypothetical protein [Verrucomicrobiae bacterium]